MARYWSTPIKRVASKVAVDTRVVLAVRRQQSAGKIGVPTNPKQVKASILTWTWFNDIEG